MKIDINRVITTKPSKIKKLFKPNFNGYFMLKTNTELNDVIR